MLLLLRSFLLLLAATSAQGEGRLAPERNRPEDLRRSEKRASLRIPPQHNDGEERGYKGADNNMIGQRIKPVIGEPAFLSEAPQIIIEDDGGDSSNDRDLIVGGSLAEAGEFPWYVSATGGYCGGSLVDPSVVLTAAHCGGIFRVGRNVWVGAFKRNSNEAGAVKRQIAKRVMHPQYNRSNFDFDIMLLQLNEPVEGVELLQWNRHPSLPMPNDVATAMGFGRTSVGGAPSQELKKVELETLADSFCQTRLGKTNFFVESMMCAMHHSEVDPQGPCQGDSGGPLIITMLHNDGTTYPLQVGLVSWAVGCAHTHFPTVYARTAGDALPWLESNICDLSREESCTTPSPAASPITSAPTAPTYRLHITFYYDSAPEETTWRIMEVDPAEEFEEVGTVFSGPAGHTPQPSTGYLYKVTVSSGTFRMILNDGAGNGLESRPTNWHFRVAVELEDGSTVSLITGPDLPAFGATFESQTFAVGPTSAPSPAPSAAPTKQPTARPTQQPTKQPTSRPSGRPSPSPTSSPTQRPTASPTAEPTAQPTASPTSRPSNRPSAKPTASPTTATPTPRPTRRPTVQPTLAPSAVPTVSMAPSPSLPTTAAPTRTPSASPSGMPSFNPTGMPSTMPSGLPSGVPTPAPTRPPTSQPTQMPSPQPTHAPTHQPTVAPTKQPTSSPTVRPSAAPSQGPTNGAVMFSLSTPSPTTAAPTKAPTFEPCTCLAGLMGGCLQQFCDGIDDADECFQRGCTWMQDNPHATHPPNLEGELEESGTLEAVVPLGRDGADATDDDSDDFPWVLLVSLLAVTGGLVAGTVLLAKGARRPKHQQQEAATPPTKEEEEHSVFLEEAGAFVEARKQRAQDHSSTEDHSLFVDEDQ